MTGPAVLADVGENEDMVSTWSGSDYQSYKGHILLSKNK